MKFREGNDVDRKSGGSPIKGLPFFLSCNQLDCRELSDPRVLTEGYYSPARWG
jgi:hypothetical protein